MADGSLIFDTKVDSSGLRKGLSGVGTLAGGVAKTMGVAFTAVTAAVAAGTAATIAAGKNYETSMAKVATMFGGVEVNVDKLDQKMLEMSSKTGQAATDLGAAMYSALSAGIPVTEDMAEATAFLEQNAKLAKGGFTDVDTAVSATAKVLNAYNLDVAETERVHGILMATQNNGITTVGELSQTLAQVTPVAAAMGVQFEYVGAALATMTAQGTPTAQATTQLKTLIAELGKSGTKAADALALATENTEYAGMSFTEMMNAGVPLNEVLNLMNGYAEANNIALLDMFSSIEGGQAALSLTGESAQTFTDNIAAMMDTTGLVDDAYNTMMDTLESQTDRLKESGTNLGISIYSGMKGSLKDMAALGNDYIAQLQKGFDEGGIDGLVSALGNVLASAITKLAKKAPDVVKLVTSLIKSLVSTLADDETADAIAEGISEALEAAFGLLDVIPDLLDAGLKIATKLISSIAEKLPDLIPKIIDVIVDTLIVLVKNAPALLKAGLQLAIGLVEGIIKALPDLIGGILGIFGDLFTEKLAVDELFAEQFDATLSAYETFKKAVADADQNFDTTVSDAEGKKDLAYELLAMYDEILGKYNGEDMTAADETKLQSIVQQLLALYPQLNPLIDANTGLFKANTAEVLSNVDALAREALVLGYQDYMRDLGAAVAQASIAYKEAAENVKTLQDEETARQQKIAALWAEAEAQSGGNPIALKYAPQFTQEGGINDLMAESQVQAGVIREANALLSEYRDALNEVKGEFDAAAVELAALTDEFNGVTPAGEGATATIENLGTKAEGSTEKVEAQTEAVGELTDTLGEAGDIIDETAENASDTTQAVMDEAQRILDTTTALEEAQSIIDTAQTSLETLIASIETNAAAALETMQGLGDTIAIQHDAVLLAIEQIFKDHEATLAQAGTDVSQAILDAVKNVMNEDSGNEIATLFLFAMRDSATNNEGAVKGAFTDIASRTHSAMMSWSSAFYSAGSSWANNLASGIRSGQGAIAAAVQSLIAAANSASSSIGTGYRTSLIPGHESGLERVPYDNYLALLHEGERVLTAAEAKVYNNAVLQASKSSPGINLNDVIATSRVEDSGVIHVTLQVGEDVIAEVFEPIVSKAQSERTSTVKG